MIDVEIDDIGNFAFHSDCVTLICGFRLSVDEPLYKIVLMDSLQLSYYWIEQVRDFIKSYFNKDITDILISFWDEHSHEREIILKLVNPFWKKMEIRFLTVEYVMRVIDDALCHSFEFKVESGEIWYREIMNKL